MVVLYQAWPTFVYTNLLTQNSIHSWLELKTFWKQNREDVVAGPSIVFTREAIVDENFFGIQQRCAKTLLGLILSNSTLTRCVNPCRSAFIRIRISIQRQVDLPLNKTRPSASKIRSCPIFNEQDRNVILKASALQAGRRELTVLELMDFVPIAIVCSEQWAAFVNFVPVKKYFTEEDNKQGSGRGELNELRRN